MENKKKSTRKILSIIIGILVVLGILVYAFNLYISNSSREMYDNFVKNDKQILINQVDLFIYDTVHNKINDAYALTDQKSIPLTLLNSPKLIETLSKYKEQDPKFHELTVIKWLSGSIKVDYKTIIYFSNNTEGQMEIGAVKENEAWKIIGIGIVTPPDKMW